MLQYYLWIQIENTYFHLLNKIKTDDIIDTIFIWSL